MMKYLNKQVRIFSAVLLSTIAMSTLQGCEDATASIDNDKKQEEVVKVPVEAYQINRADIADFYAANAVLESRAEADVISKVQGLITNVFVEEGDYVKQGQVLAKIDDSRYQLVLRQRQADLEQVKSELDRLKSAKSNALVSADRLEKLEWQYESLKASTGIAELDVKETNVVAPIDGFVSRRYVKTGNLVRQYQNQNLFHIVAQDKLEGVLYLPEGRLPQVKVDQPTVLTLPAINNRTFNAKIARISPVVDANNGTFKVVVIVDNSQGHLKPGMFAEVNIQLGLHNNALVSKSNSIISIDDKEYVYRVVDGKAIKTDIKTGYRQHGLVEILSGLKQNDLVISAGHNNLKNNSEVTVVNAQPAMESQLVPEAIAEAEPDSLEANKESDSIVKN
jgi:membrane fusion protein, multidrug efflux system